MDRTGLVQREEKNGQDGFSVERKEGWIGRVLVREEKDGQNGFIVGRGEGCMGQVQVQKEEKDVQERMDSTG